MSSVFDACPQAFVDALGEYELLPYTHDGVTVQLRGIFDNPSASSRTFGDAAPLSGTLPTLAVTDASLPPGASEGDTVVIHGVTWRVSGPLEPDGRGMTLIVLERA